jgi:hypothetical protein
MSQQTSRPTTTSLFRALKLVFFRNGVCIRVAGKPRFWVKYGNHSVIRGEGRTQAHVARIVNANPASVVRVPEVYLGFSRGKLGYIVLDFVQGTTLAQCKTPSGTYYKKDFEAVATAVHQLIDIKMPAGTAPGPVGGGYIGHDFFVEYLSAVEYPTVGSLEADVYELCFLLAIGISHCRFRALVANKVLRILRHGLRVNFQIETADGLVLCPSDLNDSNFMIDNEGKLWAIDFGHTYFLPSSFMSYSLSMLSDIFVKYVAHPINYL